MPFPLSKNSPMLFVPSVMYKLRALDLEFKTISKTGQRVEEIHVVDEASGETIIVTKEEP